MGFEIYRDKAGEWRWRPRARNGELIAAGGEAFASKANAIRAIDTVRRNAAESEGRKEILEAPDKG